MQIQRNKLRITSQKTNDPEKINHITIEISLDFDNWTATPKSKLELIIEKSPPKEKPILPNIADYPEYKHLATFNIESAANEVLGIVIKRYMMLRRTLSNENKIKLDHIFKENKEPHPYNNKELKNKLTKFLIKEKSAAFQHIKHAYSSIFIAIAHHQTFNSDIGIELLVGSLHLLYLGDQRFFNEKIKTRSEVAAEGGLSRNEHYLPTKQKSCELLTKLAPQDGWNQELDAYKAILPEIKKYLGENNIRRPALISIEKTLRRWIKNDPIVSAAVRIAQFPARNSSTD
ncbi:hypothetical protein BOP96_05720 [Pseudomonas sp. FSL W5-0203]|uniref:hypothetical protein n=1 Tax=Pseudomonas sp. FSL W5-0203 TaxID=1920491 RepID=UPI0009370C70|nr:hypothetical protein [Pseudomonas sp. FSL W5-0203]OJT31811.1 hypothetical protein BOP96_05720 [Pseudomonas sp. FSL W5-0203]